MRTDYAWQYLDYSIRIEDLQVSETSEVLLAGRFTSNSVDLDPTESVDTFNISGLEKAFATKLNSDGSYAWSYVIGGLGVTADATATLMLPDGRVLAGGSFMGTLDFDPGPGESVGTSADYLVTLDYDGQFLDVQFLGEGSFLILFRMALDGEGNVYLCGAFAGTDDFDPTDGVDLHSSASQYFRDIWLTKINADGSYGWTRTIGRSGSDQATGLAIDPEGNVVLTGTFSGAVDFDPSEEGEDLHVVWGTLADIFVSSFSPNGDYRWTQTVPRRFEGDIGVVAADGLGNAYVTGKFRETVDFDVSEGEDIHTAQGGSDLFVTQVRSDGSYGWTRVISTQWNDEGLGVVGEEQGGVVVTGSADILIAKFDADGTLAWTQRFAESAINTFGQNIVRTTDGLIVAGGFDTYMEPADLDPSCETLEFWSSFFEVNYFVAKLVCITPSSDVDDDGDSDLIDFATFVGCINSPNANTCGAQCAERDFDQDGDIDLADVKTFQQYFEP